MGYVGVRELRWRWATGDGGFMRALLLRSNMFYKILKQVLLLLTNDLFPDGISLVLTFFLSFFLQL